MMIEVTCECEKCGGCRARFDISWEEEHPHLCSWCEDNQDYPHDPGHTPIGDLDRSSLPS